MTQMATDEEEEEGRIKQGTIAQFMRKRTQLVGFEFGHWKHVQYCAEFLDNALDAIETFQWQEIENPESKISFSLDQELSLEHLSLTHDAKSQEKPQLEQDAKEILRKEYGNKPIEEKSEEKGGESRDNSEKNKDKKEIEVEEEVMRIIEDMTELIKPVEKIIDIEPMVIIRLREAEASSYLTSELNQKNVMSYTFEIFDNGFGMNKRDFGKFGRYLASSKSTQLKQTRGSQGFGAPSAFSDAQNTTGKPIISISKTADNIYATVSEFFTTSKNKKRYIIHPTDVDSPYLHGTYIKLSYLNTKYVRGYVDYYIRETAMLNSHVTIIYIDPYGEESKYPRLALHFPEEPKYAKPHPASTNIGDLQDLISKAENYLTITSFLKDNFVRISQKVANKIVELAERDLQDKLNVLILKNGYITKASKSSEDIYFMRNEKRVYGKSKKTRDQLIIYQLTSENLINDYKKLISDYDNQLKENKKIIKEIKKLNDEIENSETKKEEKKIEKNKDDLKKEIKKIRKNKDQIKNNFSTLFENVKDGLTELKKFKERENLEDLINEVEISKSKPSELTKDQFDSLFLAFKSINYMAPPTDTTIPVGEAVLENTLIKELGLKISENLDDFGTPIETIQDSHELLLQEKKNSIIKESNLSDASLLEQISIEDSDVLQLNTQILSNIDIDGQEESQENIIKNIGDLIVLDEIESKETYQEIFDYFLETFSKDDDFVAAETRTPTSGKGLAFVVEAVMAYSNSLETPKRSRDVLSRFVNRTPKLRDSADCAITKAVQSVNWKNYKLDIYDNNLPKGPIKLLINVSGPYVHLMFKSQSKNALADDENLIKEIKYCLEAIGRRLRTYLNRRIAINKREKRANLIERYIPKFVSSIFNIAKEGSKFKDQITKDELENLMRNSISKKNVAYNILEETAEPQKVPKAKEETFQETIKEKQVPSDVKKELKESIVEEEIKKEKPVPIEEVEIEKKTLEKEFPQDLNSLTIKELKTIAMGKGLNLPSKIKKSEIIKILEDKLIKKEVLDKGKERKKEPTKELEEGVLEIIEEEPEIASVVQDSVKKVKKKPPKSRQTQLPIITTERILEALSSDEWQTIKHLIFKLKIKDMLDARYLTIKLKELERKNLVVVEVKTGKKQWKKN